MAKIHPYANVHPDAKIGKNVTVEAFTTIYPDVVIGDNCWIGPNVTIFNGARLGNNIKIFPGAVISAEPQDLKFQGEKTTLEIGDNTIIREMTSLHRGTKSKGKTVIGKNSLIMAYVHIAHDCIIGDHVILVNGVQLAGEVHVDDWAIVGGTAAVHQFVRIGKHVMIQGGALVRKDIPPYSRVGREPLVYEGINSVGLKRRGFTVEQLRTIEDIYRIVFLKGYSLKHAIEEIEQKFPPSPERDEILNFLKQTKRGLVKSPLAVKNSDD
jgi:UDP-N-acetylglucosamine acyltransferase